eukprot:1134989-Amphidinium_carterae.1
MVQINDVRRTTRTRLAFGDYVQIKTTLKCNPLYIINDKADYKLRHYHDFASITTHTHTHKYCSPSRAVCMIRFAYKQRQQRRTTTQPIHTIRVSTPLKRHGRTTHDDIRSWMHYEATESPHYTQGSNNDDRMPEDKSVLTDINDNYKERQGRHQAIDPLQNQEQKVDNKEDNPRSYYQKLSTITTS